MPAGVSVSLFGSDLASIRQTALASHYIVQMTLNDLLKPSQINANGKH